MRFKHKTTGMVLLKKIESSLLILVLLILLQAPLLTKAQLITNNTLTANQLVQTVLLGGGLTATNVTYSGDLSALGSFVGSSSNIGFAGGLIMASGNIANAIGPNNTAGASSDFSTTSTDPQLSGIASSNLHDAAILEFDFVPSSDTIKFRYVFGSDEYMEFVNSSFNDVFGFFISGPNPSGGSFVNKNIALIPSTATPVTIDNVNLNTNGSYYFDNGDGSGFGTAPDGQTVQYDGFTVPITALSPVICGQSYHIKLAITDVGDGAYDSGVFLEAGSFSSAGGTTLSVAAHNFGGSVVGDDSTVYEGCGFASLLINRNLADNPGAQTLHYTITGTATSGADFTPLSDSVHFTATQDSALITINSLPDLLIEGTETVVITLFVPPATCGAADTLTKTIYIIDTPPLKVSLNDDTALICPAQNLFLIAHTAGGVAVGGCTFQWQNFSETSNTLHINPQVTTTYIVTATDSCGNSASDTCIVSFTSYVPMQLSMSNDTAICTGEHALITSNLTDGLPIYNYAWTPNVTSADSVTVTPANTTEYILTITDACAVAIADTVTVTVYPITANFDYSYISNQTAKFNNLSSSGPSYSYQWNFGDGSDDSVSTEHNPEHSFPSDGTYNVTLIAINPLGCADTIVQPITVVPDFYFYFPNSFTPNKNGLNDVYMGYGVGIKTYRMRIFDRWGQLLFESNNLFTGWDGTYKGSPVMFDTYTCVFDLEDFNSKRIRRFGSVTLVH
jgi:gliding motility-associated-like protein